MDKPTAVQSPIATRWRDPTLSITPNAFLYNTSYGSYKFNRILPYILSVSATNSSRDFILASTFIVNSSSSLTITSPTVLVANNYNFTVRYSLLSLSSIAGTVIISVSFSRTSPPKISAKLDSSLSDFNLEWIVVPSVRFLRLTDGSISGLDGYTRQTPLSNQFPYLELGNANDTKFWNLWGKIDWSTSHLGAAYVSQSTVNGTAISNVLIAFPKGVAQIDPTIIASTSTYTSNPSIQRKTFFYNNLFWVFWFDASTSNIYYRTSSTGGYYWSNNVLVTSLPNSNGDFDVAQSSSKVFVAWMDTSDNLFIKEGYMSDLSITWGANILVGSLSGTAGAPFSVSVAVGTDNYVWVSGAFGFYYRVYRSIDTTGSSYSLSFSTQIPQNPSALDAYRLLPLYNGKLFLLYSSYFDTGIYWWIYGVGGWSPTSQYYNLGLVSWEAKILDISGVVTSDQAVHLLYRAGDGSIKSAYTIDYTTWNIETVSGASSCCYYPTLTVDTMDGLHGFWVQGSAIYYSMRTPSVSSTGGTWSSASTPFGTAINNIQALTSAYSGVPAIPMLWNNGTGPTYYSLQFAALTVPINSGGAPSQPWNRPGLSPFQQYSSQLGEYVSPGNGLLYVRQTDLGIPGRGLDLSITRIYSTPSGFISGVPFNYEPYPYANLGIGWALNFPWIGTKYLHLWDGQQYFIKWSGNVFENHNGQQFSLRRSVTSGAVNSYILSMPSGVAYNFDSTGRLATIVDGTGTNQIKFLYDAQNRLSTITDTVARVATFRYDSSSRLSSVSYGGRSVNYTYVVQNSGPNLYQVRDQLGRITSFTYNNPYDSSNKWLISEIDYPSGARSTYSPVGIGVTEDVTAYLVSGQTIYDKTTVVKSVSYLTATLNGIILFNNLTFSDGNKIQGFTSYQYFPSISSMIVTDQDSNGNQLRSIRYWYGPEGEVQQQDVYRGNTSVKTFSDYYYFDEWGNLVYTKDASGHETFASFTGTNSQNQFYGPGILAQSTSGEVFHDNFQTCCDLNSTLWSTGGALSGRYIYNGEKLYMSGSSSSQGTWQTAWVVTKNPSINQYPFYLDVRANLWQNPGTVSIAADLELSPQLTAQNANPHDNQDLFRVIMNDGPYYRVDRHVSGVDRLLYDSGLTSGGATSVRWVIELLNANTVTVWLDKGKGLEQLYTTTSLGLPSNFTPAYIYLVFYNLNTQTYAASFDYIVSSANSYLTVNGLQVGQRAELYDSSNNIVDAAKLSSSGGSVTLSTRSLPQGRGFIKIYDVDRTLQYTSSVKEFRGGDVFSYTPPYVSQGLSKTTSGFLKGDSVYVDDSLPTGAIASSDGGDSWSWTTNYAYALSGNMYHTSSLAVGEHQHYFSSATAYESPGSGYFHEQFVYIPANLAPDEIMLQFHLYNGDWSHRAYWGLDLIPWGTPGTVSHKSMGPMPSVSGQWLMFIVKADDVGTSGLWVDGLAYTLYDGLVGWDYSAVGGPTTGSVTIQGLTAGQRVQLFDASNHYIAQASVPSGATQVTLDLYGAGVNVFPFTGYFRIYDSSGSTLQYRSPLMQNIWGGDVYSYVVPKFYPSASSPSDTIYAQTVSSTSGTWGNPSNILGAPDGQYAYVPWNYNGAATITVDQGSSIPAGDVYFDFYGYGTQNGYPTLTVAVAVSPDNTNWYSLLTVSLPVYNPPQSKQFYGGHSTQSFRYVKLTLSNTDGNTQQFDAVEVLESNMLIRVSGSLTFQTGRFASTPIPMQSYISYDPTGSSIQTMTLHNGNGIFTYQTRDSYGNVISNTDANNNVTTYSFPSTYQYAYPTSTSITIGGTPITSSYSYDFNTGLPLSVTNANLNTTSMTYDLLQRLKSVTYPSVNGVQSSVNYTYTDATNLLSYTDENHHVVNNHYDSLGRLIAVDRLNPNGTVYSFENYTYNWQNQIKTYRNANGSIYTYDYDFLGRPTKVTNPGSPPTYRIINYDDINNIVSMTDENGHQKQYVRDALNRITEVREIIPTSTTIYGLGVNSSSSQWTNPSNILGAPDGRYAYVGWSQPNGATIVVDLGRTAPNGDVYIDYLGYGTLTMPVAVSPDNSVWTTLSTISLPYLGWGTLQLSGGHSSQPFRYVKLTLTQMGGNTQEFDAIEIKNSNPTYYSTKYQYDEVGDLTKITDNNIQVTKNTYDDLGRLVRVDNPDFTFATFSYDKTGNMITRTDQNGKTTSLSYDGLRRLVQKTYPDLTTVSYRYDKAGNLLSIINPQASITYTYDSRNRQTSESLVVGTYAPIANYGYDKAGNLAWIRGPDAENVTYTYDPQNRLIQVGSYASFTYTKDDRVSTTTLGNGVRTTYTYDSRGRPTNILTKNGQTTLLNLAYTFDNASNVKTIGTETYTYDFLNRLTNTTGPWGSINYSYDSVGNRLTKQEGGVTTPYTYGAYNKLTSAGSTQYGYNNNGDLANKTVGSTVTTYTYTFEDKLLKAMQGSTTLGQYYYDGNELQVKRIENGATTISMYQGLSVINEYVVETSSTTKYVYAHGQIIAKTSAGTVSYYIQDSLGSTRLILSSSVQTLYSTNYKPYGLEYGASGTESYKYTGQVQDSATGLYYLHARYYDPDLGRFISADPVAGHMQNPQTLNQYTYTGNNPLRFIDPTGEDWWSTLTGAVSTATSSVGNWWNNLDPNWKTAIILSLATVAVIATAGLAGIAIAPIVTAALVGGTLSGGLYVGTSVATGKQATWGGFAAAFATGAFLGAVGGVAAKVATSAASTLGDAFPSANSMVTPGFIKGVASFGASIFTEVASGQRNPMAILAGAGLSAVLSGASGSLAEDAFPTTGRPASTFTTFAKAVFTPWNEGTTNAQAYIMRQATEDLLGWGIGGLLSVNYAALSG